MPSYTIHPRDVYTASFTGAAGHVTCRFRASATAPPLTRDAGGNWLSMQEGFSPAGDFFRRGAGNTVYVSLAAQGSRDFAFAAEFVGVCDYPDGAEAAVILSADDWDANPQNHDAFLAAAEACRSRNLWLTAAIVTSTLSDAHWGEIRAAHARGFVEIASHSATHPGKKPYAAPGAEIAGSRRTLLEKIPGADVLCWIEPSGYLNPEIASKLAPHYLVSRSTQQGRRGFCAYTSYQCFLRAGITLMLEETTLEKANATFENCRRSGGIYHAAVHPRHLDWSDKSWVAAHLGHISGHSTIFYTSLGNLYRYRFAAQHGFTLSQGKHILHAPQPAWRKQLAALSVNLRMAVDQLALLLRR